jgi:hypothetical protein
VSVLRTDKGVRLPKAELQRADVARLAGLLRGECTGVSAQSAQSMFVEAMRLTVTLGPGFGIPPGSVSPPIDLVTIPREGAIETTHLTAW